jgi:hypothetical protein
MRKRVHIQEKILVHYIDDVDSIKKPHWEMFARDRARFNDRIEQLQRILNPILIKKLE